MGTQIWRTWRIDTKGDSSPEGPQGEESPQQQKEPDRQRWASEARASIQTDPQGGAVGVLRELLEVGH